MTQDERIRILEHHVAALSEIYDSVQIMGSYLTEKGTTICQKRGSGDFYARQGMAHEFIQTNVAEDQAILIAQKLDPPDDGWKTDFTIL